jgi:phage/plasmid-associated DNA primase
VKVLLLPELREKGDISDWLGAGGTIEELQRFAAETAETDIPVNQPRSQKSPPEAGPDQDVAPPEFSENALAYMFSDRHAATLLYVHEWGRWLRFDGHHWREDHTVAVFDEARRICAEQGEIALAVLKSDDKVAAIINKAAAVAAIERLARHHHRHVKSPEDFDADPLLLNASITAGRLKGDA